MKSQTVTDDKIKYSINFDYKYWRLLRQKEASNKIRKMSIIKNHDKSRIFCSIIFLVTIPIKSLICVFYSLFFYRENAVFGQLKMRYTDNPRSIYR